MCADENEIAVAQVIISAIYGHNNIGVRKKSKIKFTEAVIMSCMKSDNTNKAIECSVKQCKHHCSNNQHPTENYCSLERVKIGTHEANPTMEKCVDCMSFSLK